MTMETRKKLMRQSLVQQMDIAEKAYQMAVDQRSAIGMYSAHDEYRSARSNVLAFDFFFEDIAHSMNPVNELDIEVVRLADLPDY